MDGSIHIFDIGRGEVQIVFSSPDGTGATCPINGRQQAQRYLVGVLNRELIEKETAVLNQGMGIHVKGLTEEAFKAHLSK